MSALVEQAAAWAIRLTAAEVRGPGDMRNAWRRLEYRYGVSWTLFWALRYRKPREITVSAYNLLRDAYVAQCIKQSAILAAEIALTQALRGPDHPAVAAAKAVVGETIEDPH